MKRKRVNGNSWDDRYNQLLEYKNEHKNCLVPTVYPKNKALGKWVANQRMQYRLRSEEKKSHLTEERIKLLSEVGFVWSHKGSSWDDRYSQLLEYKNEHKNCQVPTVYPKNKALGKWVAHQRVQYRLRSEGKQSHLTEERIKVLSEVGFVWRVNGSSWDDRYSQLLEYKAEHKNCLVPKRYSKNKALATWVGNQRNQYRLRSEGKKSQLTEERIKLLSEAGFVWRVNGSSWDNRYKAKMRKDQLRAWNDRYSQLLEYKAEHKNCLVPQDYSKNKALGKWVAHQRMQYRLRSEGKQSHLTEERIKLLSEVGFVWSRQGSSWDDRYNQLLEYKAEHKNCLVPKRYPKNKALGTWVDTQRTQYRLRSEEKKSQLEEERIKLLSEAGFVWRVKSKKNPCRIIHRPMQSLCVRVEKYARRKKDISRGVTVIKTSGATTTRSPGPGIQHRRVLREASQLQTSNGRETYAP